MPDTHNKGDLKQMQALPLEAKLIMTKRRIKQWYEYWNGEVYLAFSGGKDSTVLKHIIDSMYSDVTAVFSNTGLEYPEIQRFVYDIKKGCYKCFNSDIEIVTPKLRFDEVIKKYGYPIVSKDIAATVETARNNKDTYRYKKLTGTAVKKDGTPSLYNCKKWQYLLEAPFKISAKCCNEMKKKPMHLYEKETHKKPFIATLATESRNREVAWMKNGCNSFTAGFERSQPLSFWTEQDILHYLHENSVPYCSVYGDIVEKNETEFDQISIADVENVYNQNIKLRTTGCSRTGCIFCAFGSHLEKEPNRFQRLKTTHPKQYEYMLKPTSEGGLGMKEVLDYINVKY